MATAVIEIVVGAGILVALIPTLIAYLGNFSTTGLPFAQFFASGGVVFIVLGAGILLAIFGFLGMGKHKR